MDTKPIHPHKMNARHPIATLNAGDVDPEPQPLRSWRIPAAFVILGFQTLVLLSSADEFGNPGPLAFSAVEPSNVFATVVPCEHNDDGSEKRPAHGFVYQLDAEGKPTVKYRIQGWYSCDMQLSSDGRVLVGVQPFQPGREPKSSDVGIAFFKDGVLMRRYLVGELVKDNSLLRRTVSFYRWLDETHLGTREGVVADRPYLDLNGVFHLTTIDRLTYSFDAATGKILSVADAERPGASDQSGSKK